MSVFGTNEVTFDVPLCLRKPASDERDGEDKTKVLVGLRDGQIQEWSVSGNSIPESVANFGELAKKTKKEEIGDLDVSEQENYRKISSLEVIEGDLMVIGYETGCIQCVNFDPAKGIKNLVGYPGSVFKVSDSPVEKIIFLGNNEELDWSQMMEIEDLFGVKTFIYNFNFEC